VVGKRHGEDAVQQRHAVLRGAHQVEIAFVPKAALRSTDVRIRVAYSGICGSDLHAIDDPSGLDVTLEAFAGPIITLGHEFSGVIEEVGTNVRSVRVGSRVACVPRLACTMCRNCRRGHPVRCTDRIRLPHGCWAETITVNEAFAYAIPDGITLRTAALAEPTACSLRAIDLAAADSGSSALVIGGGPMGLLLTGLALRTGYARVLVSEPSQARRRIAGLLGAEVVDPTSEELARVVQDWSSGVGPDTVFEAVGSAATVEQAVELVCDGGTVVVVGVAPPGVRAAISPETIFAKELTIRGAWGIETTFERSIQWLQHIDFSPLLTHTFDLADISLALQTTRSGSSGKVMLKISPPIDE